MIEMRREIGRRASEYSWGTPAWWNVERTKAHEPPSESGRSHLFSSTDWRWQRIRPLCGQACVARSAAMPQQYGARRCPISLYLFSVIRFRVEVTRLPCSCFCLCLNGER